MRLVKHLLEGFTLDRLKGCGVSIIAAALFISLAGCAHQKFDCPYTDGVRCKSLSEVDKEVSEGKLGNNRSSPKKELQKLTFIPAPESALRSQEEVLRVWVAPYQSQDGTFHEEKVLHFVAKPAEWVNTVTEIRADDADTKI